IAASFAAVIWLLIEWVRGSQPKFVGLLTGAVAGLATITPCAGYVSPTTAVIVGIAAGAVCYFAVALKNGLGWDDALDVWGVHGVGGFLGIVLLGVFASTLWNPNGADGLLRGNPAFLGKQFVAALVCSAWAFTFTYAMLWLINLVTRVKVDELHEESGLDIALHGEEAYPLGV
ncbi:MAG: ammonium transporter, partial [Candidatus Eremiobacteraeota bacterium]|nr:ammonium transporter [Candidatus Eremiobacteraeota bacterium]